MKSKNLFFSWVVILFFSSLVFADTPPSATDEEGTWVWVEVGSPWYNLWQENIDPTTGEAVGSAEGLPVSEIVAAEKELGLVTGERFRYNISTGEYRKLEATESPYVVRQLKESGLLLVDVAKDTVLVIPMDVLLDYTYETIIPINDIVENRTPREVFQSVLRDVALDLRSAVGVAPQRPYGLGESGLSKMVLSLKRVDPAGIAHGSWDVVVGTVGAAEDTAVGVIRLTWQGVIVTGKAVGSTKVAKVTWRGVVSVGRFVALQGERFYRWLTK